MKLRVCSLAVLAAALLSWAAPAFSQDRVDPKSLVGTWVWQPGRQHKFVIEITEVTSDGVASGTYQHPNGKGPLKRKVVADDGSVKLHVGQQIKMDLEYDRKADALVGPATGWGPRATADFATAHFRREK
jgi:hypothetical protein